jgi:hypothetical protein
MPEQALAALPRNHPYWQTPYITRIRAGEERKGRKKMGEEIRRPEAQQHPDLQIIAMQDKITYIPQARNGFYHYRLFVFSHPDYTVGPGTSPGHAILSKRTARGLYRRSGIGKRCFPHLAPKTELYSIGYTYSNMLFKKKTSSFADLVRV